MPETDHPATPAIQRKAWQWTAIVGIALFIVGPIALWFWWQRVFGQAMHELFVGTTGPVPARADWPRPLTELLDDSGGIEIDESTIQVHALCDGYNKEFIWRMEAAPGLFALLQERWRLTPVSTSEWGVLKGFTPYRSQERVPDWWLPQDDDQTTFYISPKGFDGRGDRFRVARDKNRNTIWVHDFYIF